MAQKTVRGFAWYAYPDTFGLEDDQDVSDPGHPFAPSPGEVKVPEEVLYYRPVVSGDAGIHNDARAQAYLVVTKMQHHPRLCSGWESDPAALTDKYKSADNKVKLSRIVALHRRHVGELVECELKVEEGG